jgi:hypothetical protein
MQSCLEKRGIEERNAEIVRSDYNITDPYSPSHKDAVSDGDVQGKGTKHGGHSHFLPDCNKPTSMIDYSNFDTTKGGGLYDIEGRNDVGGRKKNITINLYNAENPYGANSINTEENLKLGQFQMK